jgi:hypothetical protein
MPINIDPKILERDALAEKALQHETDIQRKKMEMGKLGMLWGDTSSIPNNIAALIALLAFLVGMIYTIYAVSIPADKLSITIKDFWAVMIPLITLTIGYLFGNKGKKE